MMNLLPDKLHNTLYLHRTEHSKQYGTFGYLTFHNAFVDFRCDTLEPYKLNNSKQQGMMPGVYDVSFTYSPKFRLTLPLIKAPNRLGIRIHAGNIVKHTHGCVLVGSRSGNALVDSHKVLNKLLDLFRRYKINCLQITNDFDSQQTFFNYD